MKHSKLTLPAFLFLIIYFCSCTSELDFIENDTSPNTVAELVYETHQDIDISGKLDYSTDTFIRESGEITFVPIWDGKAMTSLCGTFALYDLQGNKLLDLANGKIKAWQLYRLGISGKLKIKAQFTASGEQILTELQLEIKEKILSDSEQSMWLGHAPFALQNDDESEEERRKREEE